MTREEVLDHVFESDDSEESEVEEPEYDDLYAPIADGSDDEFDDLDCVGESVLIQDEIDSEDIETDRALAGPSDDPSMDEDIGTEPDTNQLVKQFMHTAHSCKQPHMHAIPCSTYTFTPHFYMACTHTHTHTHTHKVMTQAWTKTLALNLIQTS